MNVFRSLIALGTVALLSGLAGAQRIYGADDVPAKWSGDWPEELRTIPERTSFTRTMSTLQLHEFIDALKWKSDRLRVHHGAPRIRSCAG